MNPYQFQHESRLAALFCMSDAAASPSQQQQPQQQKSQQQQPQQQQSQQQQSQQQQPHQSENGTINADVLLVTAIGEELLYLVEYVKEECKISTSRAFGQRGNTIIPLTLFKYKDKTIAATTLFAGEVGAAVRVLSVLSVVNVRVLALVGLAGSATPKVRVGSVVVPANVADFTEQSAAVATALDDADAIASQIMELPLVAEHKIDKQIVKKLVEKVKGDGQHRVISHYIVSRLPIKDSPEALRDLDEGIQDIYRAQANQNVHHISVKMHLGTATRNTLRSMEGYVSTFKAHEEFSLWTKRCQLRVDKFPPVPEEAKTEAESVPVVPVAQWTGPHASGFFTDPIIASNFVFKSRHLSQQLLAQHNRKYVAVDMESAGLLEAAESLGLPTLIVRGVSDPGDHTKKTFDEVCVFLFMFIVDCNVCGL